MYLFFLILYSYQVSDYINEDYENIPEVYDNIAEVYDNVAEVYENIPQVYDNIPEVYDNIVEVCDNIPNDFQYGDNNSFIAVTDDTLFSPLCYDQYKSVFIKMFIY